MRSFTSDDTSLAVSHPALKAAAGSDQYVLRFVAGLFSTDNKALADALADLVEAGSLRGVTELKPEAPKHEPKEAPDESKRKRSK